MDETAITPQEAEDRKPRLIITQEPNGDTTIVSADEPVDLATAITMIELAKEQLLHNHLIAVQQQRQEAEKRSSIYRPNPEILRP